MRVLKIMSSIVLVLIVLLSCQNQRNDEIIEAAISNLVRGDGSIWTVDEAMSQLGLRGLSVAVIENYKITWTKTWGVKSANTEEPIDHETAFSTASISKPITATLIAMLAEKDLIDLDTPVSKYLKRWKLPDNEFTQAVDITLRHLLSHTAGTTQHGFKDFYIGEKIPTLVQVLDGGELPGTERLTVNFKPGSQWRYSGGGYVIAQIAIEDHLGRSLADIAEEYLFVPLNLKHTTMRQPGEDGFFKNVAKAHNENGDVISGGLPICPQLAPSGVWSTPTDMAHFLIEMQNALRGAETKAVSPTVARLVTTEIMDGFGLGWALFVPLGKSAAFSHGGGNTGTGGEILGTMADGHGIAFFGNGPNDVRIPILQQFKSSIIQSHSWEIVE